MILKNLEDLPDNITRGIKLKRIVRMKPGVDIVDKETQKPAAGDYDSASQTIRLSDAIVANGEGSLLHEIGHALWFSLPEILAKKYLDLSWQWDYGNGQYWIKNNSRFVSGLAKSKHFKLLERNIIKTIKIEIPKNEDNLDSIK